MKSRLFSYITYALVLCSFYCLPVVAAPSLNTYGRLPTVGQMTISPNGNLLAFRRTTNDKDMVLIYSLKESKNIAAVSVAKIDPNGMFFHSDNVLILVVSQHKRLRNYLHAMDVSTAFSYNLKTNTINPLIRPGENLRRNKHIYVGQTGMGRILGTSKNGEYLYMPAYVSDGVIDNSPDYSLLRVKTNGKGTPRVTSVGGPDVSDFFLDDSGNVLAMESYDEKRNLHKIEARTNKKWRTIYKFKTEITGRTFVGPTSDFKKLVYVTTEDDSNHNAYFTMSLSDGTSERLPYARKNASIEAVIQDDNRVVMGIRYSGFTPSYKFFDEARQQQIDNILANFPDQSVHLLSYSRNWEKVVVMVEGSSYPGSYFVFPKAGKPTFITSKYAGITADDIHPIGKITFKARDGRAIPTLITIPNQHIAAIKNLPAVVLPHGGPAYYDTIGFDYMAQAIASQGILVMQPQFRGSTGFGREHTAAGHGEWGKKMQDDLTDTVKFFTRKGFVHPQRICIAGASYGGYAALAGAAFTPDTYQCAVSIAGISHLRKMLDADKSRYGKDSSVLSYFTQIIGGGDLNKKALQEISPYYHADKITIPVLLIHGVDDTIVEYNQSKLMHSAIRKAKGNSRLIKLKKEDHYLRDGETRQQALNEMVKFIVSHIGNS